jgi:hypothetical protein
MKKLFTLVAVAMFSLAMVACSSNVDKGKKLIDGMMEAVENEDYAKMMEIAAEMEKLEAELTDEEIEQIEDYAEEKYGDYM